MKKIIGLTALTAVTLASSVTNAELIINGDTTSNAMPTQNMVNPANTATATAQPAKAVKTKAVANQYTIDPNHANVRFAIDHFGTTTNQGGFYGLTGDMTFDPAKKVGSIDIDIPVSTLQTGNDQFTHHLKGEEFFNAEKYPTANFKSTKFHFKNGKVSKVDGNLTLLGKTKPVSLTATKFNCYDSPMLKAKVCGGDFETTIDRTQWGMDTYVKMGFAKNVKLNIQIEAAQQ